MIELRRKNSKLSPFENPSQNKYTQSLKKQIQRNINANSTTNFSSMIYGIGSNILSKRVYQIFNSQTIQNQ